MTIDVADLAGAEAARRAARALAAALGFDRTSAERITLSVSELAMNLVRYARGGRIRLRRIDGDRGPGIEVESHDLGPGIRDLDRALEDRFSTGGGLGSGLPAVRRLMDEFEITSDHGGTHIRARAWLNTPSS